MTGSSLPQKTARLRAIRNDDAMGSTERERAQPERYGEVPDLAQQFVRTLRTLRASDWLELGLVF